MFDYDPSSSTCNLAPHVTLKNRNWFDYTQANDDGASIHVLDCMEGPLNLFGPPDFGLWGQNGWTLTSECEHLGQHDKEVKSDWEPVLRSRNNIWIEMRCQKDQKIVLRKRIDLSDLSLDLNQEYLTEMKPRGILRSWLQALGSSDSLARAGKTHKVDLKIGSAASKSFELAEEDGSTFEIAHVLHDLKSIESVDVDLTITAKENGTSVFIAPPELLVDVPRHIGCFDASEFTLGTPKAVSAMTPAKCLTACHKESTDFIYGLLQDGTQCFCQEALDWNELNRLTDDKCDVPCFGNENELCGGAQPVSIYIGSRRVHVLTTELHKFSSVRIVSVIISME